MMRCPFCRHSAHTRTSRYVSDNVKESYLQCQNIYCSATFKTHESICAVIRSPVTEEKPAPVSTAPAVVRKVKGCYSSPFAYFHERRSLNNFHRDRVITFEQIA
ncbi:ogr/Delta-like zinc finger family protein, partial [Escherichia coli]|uniref:ogr/Delta-like zinc finger family protein n=5 Tax=Enterobacterales TaxID=91347 RepID=UPI00204081D1